MFVFIWSAVSGTENPTNCQSCLTASLSKSTTTTSASALLRTMSSEYTQERLAEGEKKALGHSKSLSQSSSSSDVVENGADAPVNDLPTPPPSASIKKKKKKKPKKNAKAKAAGTEGGTKDESNGREIRPPVLCISRNKHWKYISSYHVGRFSVSARASLTL